MSDKTEGKKMLEQAIAAEIRSRIDAIAESLRPLGVKFSVGTISVDLSEWDEPAATEAEST